MIIVRHTDSSILVLIGRLWAEIFEVREEGGDICWARVSDDVVPVNITCIQDNPETVFQITAYNRHVEKIFDIRLIQPGRNIIVVFLFYFPMQIFSVCGMLL